MDTMEPSGRCGWVNSRKSVKRIPTNSLPLFFYNEQHTDCPLSAHQHQSCQFSTAVKCFTDTVTDRVSVTVSNSNKCIAVRKVATPLRELTCHMGSHSVTCHPAEVIFPPLPQPKRSWYSIQRPRRDARLSWPSWLVTYWDGIPARRWSPIPVLTGPTWANFVHATNTANHYATPPTVSAWTP